PGMTAPFPYTTLFRSPELDKLSFIARAITPPYRPRRFDARFFMADADEVLAHHDPIEGEELLHVRWFSLEEAKALDLPSITRFVDRKSTRLNSSHVKI